MQVVQIDMSCLLPEEHSDFLDEEECTLTFIGLIDGFVSNLWNQIPSWSEGNLGLSENFLRHLFCLFSFQGLNHPAKLIRRLTLGLMGLMEFLQVCLKWTQASDSRYCHSLQRAPRYASCHRTAGRPWSLYALPCSTCALSPLSQWHSWRCWQVFMPVSSD